MGKDLTIVEKYDGIKKLFIDREQAIIDILPDGMDVKRMIGGLMNQIQVNPALMDCTGKSLLVCGLTAFTLGLETTPALHQVALVPFNRNININNQWKKVKEAQLMIEYRGLIVLATQSGEVVTIDAYLVYENEINQGLFTIEYGLDPKVVHKPILIGEKGKIVGTYAVAAFKSGIKKFHFMSLDEVYKRRDVSKAYQSDLLYKKNDSPWLAWEEDMIKKTAIKGLSKTLQLSPIKSHFNRAVTLDNLANAGKTQIPHLSKEIEMLDIEVDGTFNQIHPDDNQTATLTEDDFGNATEGVGDPQQETPPTNKPEVTTPKAPPKADKTAKKRDEVPTPSPEKKKATKKNTVEARARVVEYIAKNPDKAEHLKNIFMIATPDGTNIDKLMEKADNEVFTPPDYIVMMDNAISKARLYK
jgi:recombination protein RecT